MLNYKINFQRIGIMVLIFTFVLTGIGTSLGMPVSYAATLDVYVSSGGNDANDGTRVNPYATLYKAYQEVGDGGTIYVLDNIKLSVADDKKYLHLDQNKSVTISTASDALDTAVIQRGSIKGAASGEGGGDRDTLIYLEQGELTLKNIIIDASLEGNDFFNGRIMNVYNDSKLIIDEGAILRNSPSAFGGTAIYLDGSTGFVATIEMKGGEITGNKNSNLASSTVLIVDNATFIMTGGKITDNIGGGIDLSTNTNTRLELSGTAQITGNKGSGQTEKNVTLQGSTLVTLNGDFTGEVGITAHNRMSVGANRFGVAVRAGIAGLENLIADNSNLLGSYAEGSNDLVWRVFKNELNQPSNNDEITGTSPTLSGATEPLAKVTVKIISVEDPTLVITKEITADGNGNWTFPVDQVLNKGIYTINVTANIK